MINKKSDTEYNKNKESKQNENQIFWHTYHHMSRIDLYLFIHALFLMNKRKKFPFLYAIFLVCVCATYDSDNSIMLSKKKWEQKQNTHTYERNSCENYLHAIEIREKNGGNLPILYKLIQSLMALFYFFLLLIIPIWTHTSNFFLFHAHLSCQTQF